jgi:uncharacterized protein
MTYETLEEYIRQLPESHKTPEVTIAWQCGEPTPMRLDLLRKSVGIANKYKIPGRSILQPFQIKEILLEDDGGKFFRKRDFLIGLRVVRPPEIHDARRRHRNRGRTEKGMRQRAR